VGKHAIAGRISVTTTLSAASGAIAAVFVGPTIDRTSNFNLVDALNGVLAGLVSITGPCAVVTPYGAIIIGIIGAILYKLTSMALLKLRIDDPVDAFAVHGACGMWGVLASGFFATQYYTAEVYGRDPAHDDWGVFYGGKGRQLGVQILDIVCTAAWASLIGVLVFGTFILIDRKRDRPLFIFKGKTYILLLSSSCIIRR
jgi:Amt family ammonium transporter